ncbi:hypothetical protein NUU24_25405 [Escherichia coli]|uniref:hypothetical protein n=1 Tax=Escherichia coli TaxID=562 RepID=UPI00214FA8E7|nr:hypothetical protein [Escherichia coli]MCR4252242.1 hypothetical protein [Escherichia coli]MCR4274383.1 hypothetical protein [Escherichia coli]
MLDIPAKDDPFYVLYPLLGHCFVDEPDNLMIFFMQKKQFIDIGGVVAQIRELSRSLVI